MFEPSDTAWHNGRIVYREQAAPSIVSHSLHLGIGVFDGMMAYWNDDHYYVHSRQEHIARLRNGSFNMGLKYQWSDEELANGIKELLERIPEHTYYIRPIVYRPLPQINVAGADKMPVDVAILAIKAPRAATRTLTVHLSPIERVSGKALPVAWKVCGTYVNSYLARKAAEDAGYDDGIMLDQDGYITEASAANLFLVKGQELYTPELTPEVFPGITRRTVIDIAKTLNLGLIEQRLRPEDLPQFEGAFLASTLMELKPLSLIAPYEFDSENAVFHRILREFSQITHQ